MARGIEATAGGALVMMAWLKTLFDRGPRAEVCRQAEALRQQARVADADRAMIQRHRLDVADLLAQASPANRRNERPQP
jgi:hypothetical protein